LQDSTIIKLPLRLFEVFSGVKNAHDFDNVKGDHLRCE
jgi:hypothetical protein